jgi:ABC-2 type transport system permease protein
MLNLILKDIIVQKKTIFFGLAYILGMALAFSGSGGTAAYFASMLALCYLLIQTPCAHDDKNRADYLFNSLPVSRGAIVTAKYLSVLFYVAIAIVEYMIVYVLVKVTSLPFTLVMINLEGIVGVLAVAALFAAVFYPIFFKFGYMKTRYINVAIFAAFFGMGSILLASLKDNTMFQSLSASLDSQPAWLVGCGIVGIILGIVLVSYLLSLQFYKRREF